MDIEFIEAIDSTSTELIRRALADGAGAIHARAIVADRQTAGRGQYGRRWVDRGELPGASLLLSVGWAVPREARLDGLSLSVGVVLAQVLEAWAKPPRALLLKWPNDVLLDGGKVGGILVEAVNPPQAQEGRAVVIGIGVNLCAAPDPVCPPEAAAGTVVPRALTPETSAPQALREAVLARLLPRLEARLEGFVRDGFAKDRGAYQARMAWRGRAVRVEAGDGSIARGILLGVTSHGALRLEGAAGRLTLHSGTVRLDHEPPRAIEPVFENRRS
ncbi:MAG: biotin--[acetyl-CoA-carboxylase] ligase [Casimicrobiaceae bacterium]|nr:biotin--[acetyl-CoA-carboxylase] ligase [Casimicrobiaceae bacterium]MDW8311568.1 biotin--[acetyl-CoA-carboxylase] ligase [Burkholderiales bacterium]